jgi:hypothetical protein
VESSQTFVVKISLMLDPRPSRKWAVDLDASSWIIAVVVYPMAGVTNEILS